MFAVDPRGGAFPQKSAPDKENETKTHPSHLAAGLKLKAPSRAHLRAHSTPVYLQIDKFSPDYPK
jgi:hypothetical protein